MRSRVFTLMAAALVSVGAHGAHAAISCGTPGDGHAGGISSITVSVGTSGSAVAAGDLIPIWIVFNKPSITWTVTDSVSDTVRNAIPYGDGGGASGYYVALYYVQNTAGASGGMTVTVNSGGTTGGLEVVTAACSGAATSGALDVAATTNAGHGGTLPVIATSGPLTPSASGDLAWTLAMNVGTTGPTYAWNNGFTEIQASGGAGNFQAADQIVSSATTSSVSLNETTGTLYWISAFALFKPASGGASCTNSGYEPAGGVLAVPNGTSGTYLLCNGHTGTPDCSSVVYYQPVGGKCAVN